MQLAVVELRFEISATDSKILPFKRVLWMLPFFCVHWYATTNLWGFLAFPPAFPALPTSPTEMGLCFGDGAALAECLIPPTFRTAGSAGKGGFGRGLRYPRPWATNCSGPRGSWGVPQEATLGEGSGRGGQASRALGPLPYFTKILWFVCIMCFHLKKGINGSKKNKLLYFHLHFYR